MSVLNDIEKIRAVDPDNMYNRIFDLPEQMAEALRIGQSWRVDTDSFADIKNVVVIGMGGSAIGGDLVRTFLASKLLIPFHVCRHYALPEYVDYEGENVLFYLPGDMCLSPTGITLDEMMNQFEVPAVADAVYELQYDLLGIRPYWVERQFWVGMVATETSNICGLSGNPIKLGFRLDKPVPTSCVQVGLTGEPHWSVYFHELGHQAGSSLSLSGFFHDNTISIEPAVFTEANASICALYAMKVIIDNPNIYDFKESAIESLNSSESYGGFMRRRNRYLSQLAIYEEDPQFGELTPDIVDGIYVTLCELYGWNKLERFFSIFLPETDLLPSYSKSHHNTFFVASLSAAFEDDLLSIFVDTWGFPVDEVAYYEMLPELRRRASLRDECITEVQQGR